MRLDKRLKAMLLTSTIEINHGDGVDSCPIGVSTDSCPAGAPWLRE